MSAKFVTSHTTNRMDEIVTIEILEPVLVWIMGVGAAIKVIRRRILPTLLITSVLSTEVKTCGTTSIEGLTR